MAVTPEEQKNARRKAMLLLEHMDRTEKGLSDRLRQAGFSAEATEDAMNYVRSYGYLNDHRYAMNYISFRMGTKGKELTARLPLQPGKRQQRLKSQMNWPFSELQ